MDAKKAKRAKTGRLLRLLAAVALTEIVGIAASVFTIPAIGTWYATLNKPGFTPPNWLFGPVWITLYALMGIASFLVWEKGMKRKEVRGSLAAFGVQLSLNFLWSVLFFGLHSLSYGLADIIALLIAIAFTIRMFYKVSKPAAYLMIPYILWVVIAMMLNLYVLKLN